MEPESPKAPTVSVILVNYRGADDTIEALKGVEHLDWPTDRLEVIVVDNASGDDSLGKIRAAAASSVKLIALDTNTGFAGGCNRGVDEASGDYVAFINNDARPDPRWLSAAVPVLEAHGSVGCVASKVLDWEGKTIDYGGSALAFYGHGFKLHTGESDSERPDQESDVLFPSGAAMVMERDLFLDVGGFDSRYFMFFEDVDLGVRLWVLGYRVRYVPDSIVYHKFHASMRGVKTWREHFLLERNALFTMFKNYDDQNLAALFGPAVVLAALRGAVLGGDTAELLDLALAPELDDRDVVEVHGHTATAALALASFAEALPELVAARREIQSRRTRPDREVFALFRLPLRPNIEDPRFVGPFNAALDAFGVNKLFGKRSRIVVATGDTLSPTMAGPAIRAWEIARALAPEHEVRLVSTTEAVGLSDPDLQISKVGAPELAILEGWCDIFIFQGYLMEEYPFLKYSKKVMVVDVYDPFHLEQLEQARDLTRKKRRQVVLGATRVLNDQLARGDLFMCASEKQRDFWLGQLAGMGRINPLTYDAGETLRGLVTVVPFGVSDAPPRHTRPVLKGWCRASGPMTRSSSGAAGSTTGSIPSRSSEPLTSFGPVSTTCGSSSWACGTQTPTSPRCGWPRRPDDSPKTSVSSGPTSSSTRAGSSTPNARTTCSSPMSASVRISSTSRPSSRSAPASSTTSGPHSPWSRRVATRSPSSSRRASSASPSLPATSTGSKRRSIGS